METEEMLADLARQEKKFDNLYRNVGNVFGQSDCAMWVLYYLISSEEVLSQQDLIERMMFPKQTINSAVSALGKKGLVKLFMIPGTKNKKKIELTEEGRALAQGTVERMRKAECRAVEAMGEENVTRFYSLYQEFFRHLETEFQKEGIVSDAE